MNFHIYTLLENPQARADFALYINRLEETPDFEMHHFRLEKPISNYMLKPVLGKRERSAPGDEEGSATKRSRK